MFGEPFAAVSADGTRCVRRLDPVRVRHRPWRERLLRGDRPNAGEVGQVWDFLSLVRPDGGLDHARVLVRFPTRPAAYYRVEELEPAPPRP